MNVTSTWIGNLEKGRDRPPTIKRCRQLADILDLSDIERKRLIDLAMEERNKPEVAEWLNEKYSQEIIEALKDPIAVKALLATHKNKEDFKSFIREIVKGFPHLSGEDQKAILKLCST